MPNFWRFNQTLFNAWSSIQGARGKDSLIFNWFWLQNDYFITTKVNVWNMPNINLLTYTNPKSDWGGLLDRFYKQRNINVEGHIIGNSLEHTQELIDNLKTALSEKQGYLDFQMPDWVYRRILCTLTNADIINRESYDIEHASYKLTFRAEKPFWQEKTWETYLFPWITDDINESIVNPWSQYSNPIINIVFNSASSTNSVSVWVWDNNIIIEWLTESTLTSATYRWDALTLTQIWDNSWQWIRPSTLEEVIFTVTNSWVVALLPRNQTVQLEQISESQWSWTSRYWYEITATFTIIKTWVFDAWDVVDINTEEKYITINWITTDYKGKFPKLEAGVNILNVSINWTFNADVSVLYPKNYL